MGDRVRRSLPAILSAAVAVRVPWGRRRALAASLAGASLLLAMDAGPARSQTPADALAEERLWATVGVGRGTVALAGFGALTFASLPHLLSARVSQDAGITTGGSRTDVGVLYGRMVRWSGFYLRGSAGLAYVRHDPSNDRATDGLGVPLSAAVGWTPLPVLGLGVHLVGNVNSTEFFGGVTLSVDLGWVP